MSYLRNLFIVYTFCCALDVAQAEDAIHVQDAQVILIQNTTLAAPIAGTIREIVIKEGDSIQKGDLLAGLDDRQARAELVVAEAAHQAARIQASNDVGIRYAQRTMDVRQRELTQSEDANARYSGSVTATEIDRLQLVIDQAELSVEQAQQEREVAAATTMEKQATARLAELRLRDHKFHSDINGRIAEVLVQAGQWVEPGQPLARVISLDPIRVSCFVDGRQYDRSLVGYTAEFSVTDPNNTDDETQPPTYRGVVTFVSDELNPVTSQVRLWARIDNFEETLRPGMRGSLKIKPSPASQP